MFARVLDFELKPEKKDDFVKVLKNQVLPILKNQNGFLEILTLFPENMKQVRVCTLSLWNTKSDADRYDRETYNRVFDIVKPFLATPVNINFYNLETTLCEHFVEALTA